MELHLEKAKEIQLEAIEKILEEALIPFLEEKIKDSASPIDDMIFAAIKPAILEFIKKIDGK